MLHIHFSQIQYFFKVLKTDFKLQYFFNTYNTMWALWRKDNVKRGFGQQYVH